MIMKFIRIYFFATLFNIILFFILSSFSVGNYSDGIILIVGFILTLQNSFIISLLFYLIDLTKTKI